MSDCIKPYETVLFTTESLTKASNLRAKLIEKVPFLWVYIYKLGTEYKLSVATAFNGKVPDATLKKINGIVSKVKS